MTEKPVTTWIFHLLTTVLSDFMFKKYGSKRPKMSIPSKERKAPDPDQGSGAEFHETFLPRSVSIRSNAFMAMVFSRLEMW